MRGRQGRSRLYLSFLFFYSFLVIEFVSSLCDLSCVLCLDAAMPFWVWILTSSIVLLTIVKNLAILHFCQTNLQNQTSDIFLSQGSFRYFLLKLNTFRLLSSVLLQYLPIFGIQYFVFEKMKKFYYVHFSNNVLYFLKSFSILINLLFVVRSGTRKLFLLIYGLGFGAVLLSALKLLPFIINTSDRIREPHCSFAHPDYNPMSTECITDYDWLFVGCLAFLELQTLIILLCIPKHTKSNAVC